jgi:DNA-binding SARP family transcriptional activator/tetratricopeptide (TPR) repeat protein
VGIRCAEAWTPIASGMQRAVLALLALDAGRAVSRDEIVDALWGDRPPRTAVNLVHVYIGHLRRLLAAVTGAAADSDRAIVWGGGGYRLAVGWTDVSRFDEQVSAARAYHAAGQEGAALAAYRAAAAWWRGPVAADAPTVVRQLPAAVALQRRRITATVEWADLAGRSGDPAEVAERLRDLAHAEPLHEALHARLMLLLAARDDQVGALRVFADLRARLADELGVEPGDEVAAAHVRVLRGHAAGRRSEAVGPAQLPAGVATFTGRAELMAGLDALLPGDARSGAADQAGRGGGPASPAVCLVTGPAGVGKSALATVWAHRVRERFPSGQLYVDLRGHASSSALRPVDALVQLLLGLGVRPEQIPTELEPAAALFRSRLSGQRALVVLDDAYSVEQVRPLLPAEPGCVVIVTSRHQLDGLVARHDAHRVGVPLLTPGEATELLGRLLGRGRIEAEPAATALLVELCEGLPLALRVAAANLRSAPERRLEGFVTELAAGDRLGRLQVPGDEQGGVRRAFEHSYRLLSPDTARVFRLLGLAPGGSLAGPGVAALAALPEPAAGRALEELVGANLVEAVGSGRYAMHDLLRLYAAERAATGESDEERVLAPLRLCRHYLALADESAEWLNPGSARLPTSSIVDGDSPVERPREFLDRAAALTWLDEERPNLVVAVRYAAEHGHWSTAVLLADALRGYFHLRMHSADWREVASLALQSARAGADVRGAAAAELSLALLNSRSGDRRQATVRFTEALRLARRSGWLPGATAALSYLGSLQHMAGHPARAAALYRRAYALNRRADRPAQQATNLLNLGLARFELGWPVLAARHYAHAGRIYGAVGSVGGEGVSLANLGETDVVRGRFDRASRRLLRALAKLREVGHRGGQAEALRCLAWVRRDQADLPAAVGLARAALDLALVTGHRRAEISCRHTLATILHRLGDADAEAEYSRALAMARDDGDGFHVAACLSGEADVRREQGDIDAALRHASEALAIARRGSYRLREADALAALAAALWDADRLGEAARAATLATVLFRCAGAVQVPGTALAVLRATPKRLGMSTAPRRAVDIPSLPTAAHRQR